MDILVNQAVSIPFISAGLTTGKTAFSPSFVVAGALVTGLSPTYTELGGGLYVVSVVPATTGHWTLFIEGAIQAQFDVWAQVPYSVLTDLHDEALSSWSWNKVTGVLTLYRSDSSTLGTYNVVDTLELSSKEVISVS